MKIILLVENSIHEVTYPAGSELEVADFEGEFLIGKHKAKRADEKDPQVTEKIKGRSHEKRADRLPRVRKNAEPLQ